MKVIAVFNVDDEKFKGLDYDDLRAKLEAPGYTVSLIDANVRVRPLPQKKTEEGEKRKYPFNDDLFWDLYIQGWNECLDEIIGKTEWKQY